MNIDITILFKNKSKYNIAIFVDYNMAIYPHLFTSWVKLIDVKKWLFSCFFFFKIIVWQLSQSRMLFIIWRRFFRFFFCFVLLLRVVTSLSLILFWSFSFSFISSQKNIATKVTFGSIETLWLISVIFLTLVFHELKDESFCQLHKSFSQYVSKFLISSMGGK